jgi:hypothetical protein
MGRWVDESVATALVPQLYLYYGSGRLVLE